MTIKMIEAGHFYECNGPSNVSLKGWQIGQERIGSEPSADMALFVDDYHSEQVFVEDGEVFLGDDVAETMIGQAGHVFYERDIAQTAPEELTGLFDNPSVKTRKGVISVAGVRLGELDDSGELLTPTCTFLDYILLCKKAGIAPEQATVLPATYEKQQANLLKVLDKLTVPGLAGYTVILFGTNGSDSLEEITA